MTKQHARTCFGALAMVAMFAATPALAGGADQALTAAAEQFRQRYSHHIQSVAVTKPDADGHVAIVISEPPPSVTPKALERPFGANIRASGMAVRDLGPDGYLADYVIGVSSPDPIVLAQSIKDLNLVLFGTDHGANLISLDGPPPAQIAPEALDLHIQTTDLRSWLIANGEVQLTPVAGGLPTTFAKAMGNSNSNDSVVFTTESELVVWIIPRDGDLSQQKTAARMYAVESDLTLGAIANVRNVAVVGRLRRVPIETLPALRFESLVAMVLPGPEELYQSFERTNLFSGKRSDLRDWCPAILSPNLLDTEVGALLVRSDTYLKNQSMGGKVTYEGFPQLRLKKYPFAGRPIAELIGGKGVTFNWNSFGSVVRADADDFDILAFTTTGALPVRYLPDGIAADGKIQEYEIEAQKHFASLGNPDLVRTAQYGQFFQIFRAFGVQAKGPERAESDAGAKVISQEATLVLGRLAGLNAQSRERIIKDLAVAVAPEGEVRDAQVAKLGSWFTKLAELKADHGELGIKALADRLARPRAKKGNDKSADVVELLALAVQSERSLIELLNQMSDLDRVSERYMTAMRRYRGANRWLRTPSIAASRYGSVLGQLLGGIRLVGGHNLVAQPPRVETSVRLDPTVPQGKMLQEKMEDGTSITWINPIDYQRFRKFSEVLKLGEVPLVVPDAMADGSGVRGPPPIKPGHAAPSGGFVPGPRRFWNQLDATALANLKLNASEKRRPPAIEIVRLNETDQFFVAVEGLPAARQVHGVEDLVQLLIWLRRLSPDDGPFFIAMDNSASTQAYYIKLSFAVQSVRAGLGNSKLVLLIPSEGQAGRFLAREFGSEIAVLADYGNGRAEIGTLKSGEVDGGPGENGYLYQFPVTADPAPGRQAKGRLSTKIKAYLPRISKRTVAETTEAVQKIHVDASAQQATLLKAVANLQQELSQLGLAVDWEVGGTNFQEAMDYHVVEVEKRKPMSITPTWTIAAKPRPTSVLDCGLALATPTSKSSFFTALQTPAGRDFVPNIVARMAPDNPWGFYAEHAHLLLDVAQDVERLGIEVIHDCDLDGLEGLFQRHQVVTVLAHAPAGKIELADGIHPPTSLADRIPTNFSGIIDLSACASIEVGRELRRLRPSCEGIRVLQAPVPVARAAVMYRHVIRLLSSHQLNYLEAVAFLTTEGRIAGLGGKT